MAWIRASGFGESVASRVENVEKFDAETRLEETSTSSEDPDQTRERH
jgi:hypothetical protein